MTPELTLLGWTLVLAVVQILIVATVRTLETGLPYAAGARDAASPVPPRAVTGRLIRAQRNLFETLPLFAVAILVAHVAQLDSALTSWGAMLYFWGRVIYLPIYALGISYARTLVWGVSLAGLVMVLVAVLHPV